MCAAARISRLTRFISQRALFLGIFFPPIQFPSTSCAERSLPQLTARLETLGICIAREIASDDPSIRFDSSDSFDGSTDYFSILRSSRQQAQFWQSHRPVWRVSRDEECHFRGGSLFFSLAIDKSWRDRNACHAGVQKGPLG